MKTLREVTDTLRDLHPHHDTTIGNRRLANWELQALREQASEFAEVQDAVSRYDNAGVRYTVALSLAASNYAALTRDSRPSSA